MTRERFEVMVRRLEGQAEKRPGLYRLRVGLLALLGYAYILAVLAALVAVVGLLVMALVYGRSGGYGIVKLAWILGAFAVVILRALWVRIPPPSGLVVEREHAPRLFELVDDLSRALKAPRFDQVLVSREFNASVAQWPRLGILGFPKNSLVLGLALMQGLSPEHFRAVLAHELGHLSGNHGRFSVWIYRVRQAWDQLLERLGESRHWGTFIFERFFGWYAPYFDASSFVLVRAHEYYADRCSAQATAPRQAAEALLLGEVQGKVVSDRFWPGVYKQADKRPSPPVGIFADMAGDLRAGAPAEDAARWLQRAWAAETDTTDTHPSLRDRVTALGWPFGEVSGDVPAIPDPPAVSAAEHFLGESLDTIREHLDLHWRAETSTAWEERYDAVLQVRDSLRELDGKPAGEPLTDEEAWDRARLTAEFGEPEAAIPLLSDFVAAHPDHAAASFMLGSLLLGQEDEAGIAHVERAMARVPDAVLPGCECVYTYLREQGRTADAEQYRERAIEQIDLLRRAHAEREQITPRDTFLPHDLPPDEVAAICEKLAEDPEITCAYLVRRPVTLLPERPLHILGFARESKWYRFEGSDAREYVDRVTAQLSFPGDAYVLLLNSSNRGIEKTMRKVDGACIYRRAR